jgi:hypothetical protein
MGVLLLVSTVGENFNSEIFLQFPVLIPLSSPKIEGTFLKVCEILPDCTESHTNGSSVRSQHCGGELQFRNLFTTPSSNSTFFTPKIVETFFPKFFSRLKNNLC